LSHGLNIDDLTVVASGRRILEGVSLHVAPGECLAVVGPNGAGKSTLLRAALGLSSGCTGQVTWNDEAVRSLDGRTRAAALAWLPQRTSIREILPVLDFVKAARFRFAESRTAATDAALSALAVVHAEALAERTLTTLSGGEFQRVMMATLIAQDAQTFLLDEPANHLDPARQVEFYRMISEQWQAGRSVVCVTHDINLLSQLAPSGDAGKVRVLGLREGSTDFEMPLNDVRLREALESVFSMHLEVAEVAGRSYFLPTSRTL
jgi:iron complex transport system ATP-binding protein